MPRIAIAALGLFGVLGVVDMHNARFRPAPARPISYPVMVAKPIVLPAATHTGARTVSAFAVESAMTPTALLDRWDPMIVEASRRFGVPQAWIRNVMRAESGGRTMLAEHQPMISDRGALGLMQVLPGTYAEMRAENALGTDPFDPHDNILAGAAYLRWLRGKYGYPAMFAAYNDGPGKLEDHLFRGRPLPDETKSYVAGITKALGSGTEWVAASDKIDVTRPDGSKVALDRAAIRSVRAAQPDEYAPGVLAVIDLGQHQQQGVRESAASLLAMLHHS